MTDWMNPNQPPPNRTTDDEPHKQSTKLFSLHSFHVVSIVVYLMIAWVLSMSDIGEG